MNKFGSRSAHWILHQRIKVVILEERYVIASIMLPQLGRSAVYHDLVVNHYYDAAEFLFEPQDEFSATHMQYDISAGH